MHRIGVGEDCKNRQEADYLLIRLLPVFLLECCTVKGNEIPAVFGRRLPGRRFEYFSKMTGR